MTPSAIRELILHEHQEIRALLDRLETIVRRVGTGDRQCVPQAKALHESLCGRVAAKAELEAEHLEPVLRNTDSWGPARAERLCEHQRAQRGALDGVTRQQTLEPARLAECLERCVACVRDDIEREESELLDEELLRDDVIGICVEGG